MKIYKTRAASPYLPNGRTRFNLREIPGVYIIYDKGTIYYVGSGGNAYRAFYRHFQKWKSRQRRVTFAPDDSDITARMIYTKTLKQAREIEIALILKYRPEGNPNKYLMFDAEKKEKNLANSVEIAPTQPIITAQTGEDFAF